MKRKFGANWLITIKAGTGKQSLVDVCYWPDLATFPEDSERKEMCYFTEPMSDYFVRVISEKNPGRWQTQKFRGEKAHTDGIRFNVSRCDASHDDVRTGTG